MSLDPSPIPLLVPVTNAMAMRIPQTVETHLFDDANRLSSHSLGSATGRIVAPQSPWVRSRRDRHAPSVALLLRGGLRLPPSLCERRRQGRLNPTRYSLERMLHGLAPAETRHFCMAHTRSRHLTPGAASRDQVSGTKSCSPIPCKTRNTAEVSPALATR